MKQFLAERGVRYTLKDLRFDRDAQREFLARGFLLPPVTVVDGVAVAGFNPERLEALLDEAAGLGEGS